MRYSYEKECPLLFVWITVSAVIWLNSAGPFISILQLWRFFSLSRSSINYAHSFFPFNPSANISPLLYFLNHLFHALTLPIVPTSLSLHSSLPFLPFLNHLCHPPFIYVAILNVSFICLFFLSLPTLDPRAPSPRFVSYSACLSSFSSPGEVNRNWFLQSLHRRAQRGKKTSPVKDYEADP